MKSFFIKIVATSLYLGLMVSCRQRSSPKPVVQETDTSDSAYSRAGSIFEGYHEDWGPEYIVGWAWDSAHPDDRIDVDIFVDGKLVTKLAADILRQDLKEAGKGDGKHGIAYKLPENLKDGKAHTIKLMFSATQKALGYSPRTLVYSKSK